MLTFQHVLRMGFRRRASWMTLVFAILLLSSASRMVIQQLRWNAQERVLESRHPLSQRHERLRAPALAENKRTFRYLTFGSSITWGTGLDDPQRDAYPGKLYLSSQDQVHVRNVAVPNEGIGSFGVLSAACTQSMVGDDQNYNVITIEIDDGFDPSLAVLAHRLRQRFPAAMILFVRLWNPSNIRYQMGDGTSVDLNTWRLLHQDGRGNMTLDSSELLLKILQSGPEHWSVRLQRDDGAGESSLRETMHQVGASLITLPSPGQRDFAFPQNLNSFMEFFQTSEPYALSARGHQVLADTINQVVQKEKSVKQRLNQDKIGSWGSGDSCHLWYYNGDFDVVSTSVQGTRRLGFSHQADTPSHKHAIEFARNADGYVTITNPFPEPRLLYLTYMTASDEEYHARVYPRTRVRLNSRPSVVIDPYNEQSDDENEHLTRTSVVGVVDPGQTVINLDPLEPSRYNFRLVGASILATEASDLAIDFSFEPATARDTSSQLFSNLWRS